MSLRPLRVPWIASPGRGRMPRYGDQVWENDPRNVYCPDCRGVLTKAERFFDPDTGLWMRRKICMKCGNRLYEQPRTRWSTR